MNKIVVVLMLTMLVLSVSVYGQPPVDTEVNTQINTTAQLDARIGAIWGFDFTSNQSGFREIVELDFAWDIHSYTQFESDTDGISVLSEPYGMVRLSGLHLEFTAEGESGDFSEISGSHGLGINYEQIYGQINFFPFYLLLASSNSGNHFTRVGGFNFRRSTSAIRANWAHMDYRIQWDGVVSTDLWSLSGSADGIKNLRSTSLIGLGYEVGETEMMFAVGSPSDWETNTENRYDFGYSIETPLVDNLTMRASVATGINYDVMPLQFGTSFGYRHALNNTLTLRPYIAADGWFRGTEDNMFDRLRMEQTAGIVLEWPGPTGWGYDPLLDMELNRFSGLSISLQNLSPDVTDGEFNDSIALAISLVEETSAGLVPGLGASSVFEIKDLQQKSGQFDTSYGLYMEYDLDQFLPFARVLKTDASSGGFADEAISLETGVQLRIIPNAVITAKYFTSEINDVQNADTSLATIEVLVTL